MGQNLRTISDSSTRSFSIIADSIYVPPVCALSEAKGMIKSMKLTIEKIMQGETISKSTLEEAIKEANKIISKNIETFGDKFLDSNTTQLFYKPTENVEWTTGFWTGSIWLAYEFTGDEQFKKAGEMQVDSFKNRIEKKIDVNHHDMGFLYSLSCVAAYKLTGNGHAKEAAIKAADHLLERYQEKGQFIQAWGNIGEEKENRLIIDCLLNLPLLYWASQVTKDKTYAVKAENHIKTAMQCIVRPDASTYHTYFFDAATGAPLYGVTHQGNRNDSAWARGQAWGIYGIALSYRYLHKPQYMELFHKVTKFFLEALPEDLIPYWDFDFSTWSKEPRDSSALAIAVCGILEMINYMDEQTAYKYKKIASVLMQALVTRCGNRDIEYANGLLLHGTYARGTASNTCTDRGVDECNTWGDYFYMEALTRMRGNWNPYW